MCVSSLYGSGTGKLIVCVCVDEWDAAEKSDDKPADEAVSTEADAAEPADAAAVTATTEESKTE